MVGDNWPCILDFISGNVWLDEEKGQYLNYAPASMINCMHGEFCDFSMIKQSYLLNQGRKNGWMNEMRKTYLI